MRSGSKYAESVEERTHRRMQVLYSHKMHERQLFMDDLKTMRNSKEKQVLKVLRDAIGPRWYQTLSCAQQNSLKTLEQCIYNDLLEGRPVRTMTVIKALDIYPRPNKADLMECIYMGRDDPKKMLAHMFLIYYGHSFDGKQISYCLNARLMLSSILYLGLDNLIELLKQRFKPDEPPPKPPPKPKPKPEPQPTSPYLRKMTYSCYEGKKSTPFKPLPLPNLDELNEEGFEEDPIIPKPPPPPPPPPPPKKVLPRAYCDRLAGVAALSPPTSVSPLSPIIKTTGNKSKRGTDYLDIKKTYGMGTSMTRRPARKKKPAIPSTGLWNAQYTINGVYTINGKPVFVLGNVTILSPLGEIIHGGFKCIGGECINIHLGIRGKPTPPKPPSCDCLKKYQDSVMDYLKKSKCYCGHRYDYGNEGSFPSEELHFFEKPTKNAPFGFNYNTIYDVNEKRLAVDKEFKKLWDTSSLLNENVHTMEKKDKKKKKRTHATDSCLGQNPRPEDYLRCALRLIRRVNIAACLPDIHLVPELKEWMRRRMYGPLSRLQKLNTLHRSNTYWVTLESLARRGYGHLEPPFEREYIGHSNWVHKQRLNDKFRNYAQTYRLNLFRRYAYLANLMWPSFFQAQFPDEKFRQIYFSYLYSRIEDLQLMHPYSTREAIDRAIVISKKRYCCIPAGIERVEK